MTFDAADLAIIETSLDVIPEPQRGLIEGLVEMVRKLQDEVNVARADAEITLAKYRDGVSDATKLVNKLTRNLDDTLDEAKRLANELEDELERLDE